VFFILYIDMVHHIFIVGSMKQEVKIDTKQRLAIGGLVVLSFLAFGKDIVELFQRQGHKDEHELILILSHDNSRVQILWDSMAIANGYIKLGINPHFRHIASWNELLQVLQQEKYFYHGLSLYGHGSPYLIESDKDDSSFRYDAETNSLKEERHNNDITWGFLERNQAIFRAFAEQHLDPNAQITLFSCLTGSDTTHYKKHKVPVVPIAQSIANTFDRNTLAPVHSIAISGSYSKWDTIYPVFYADFLEIWSADHVTFDPDGFETIVIDWSIEGCSAKGPIYGNDDMYVVDNHGKQKSNLGKHQAREGKATKTTPGSFRLFKPKHQKTILQ